MAYFSCVCAAGPAPLFSCFPILGNDFIQTSGLGGIKLSLAECISRTTGGCQMHELVAEVETGRSYEVASGADFR